MKITDVVIKLSDVPDSLYMLYNKLIVGSRDFALEITEERK